MRPRCKDAFKILKNNNNLYSQSKRNEYTWGVRGCLGCENLSYFVFCLFFKTDIFPATSMESFRRDLTNDMAEQVHSAK